MEYGTVVVLFEQDEDDSIDYQERNTKKANVRPKDVEHVQRCAAKIRWELRNEDGT